MTDAAVDYGLPEKLPTAVIGDILDQLGYVTQFLPADVRPITNDMKVVGRAMPVQLAAASKVRGQGFTNLTAALDALRPGEIYLASGGKSPSALHGVS